MQPEWRAVCYQAVNGQTSLTSQQLRWRGDFQISSSIAVTTSKRGLPRGCSAVCGQNCALHIAPAQREGTSINSRIVAPINCQYDALRKHQASCRARRSVLCSAAKRQRALASSLSLVQRSSITRDKSGVVGAVGCQIGLSRTALGWIKAGKVLVFFAAPP